MFLDEFNSLHPTYLWKEALTNYYPAGNIFLGETKQLALIDYEELTELKKLKFIKHLINIQTNEEVYVFLYTTRGRRVTSSNIIWVYSKPPNLFELVEVTDSVLKRKKEQEEYVKQKYDLYYRRSLAYNKTLNEE